MFLSLGSLISKMGIVFSILQDFLEYYKKQMEIAGYVTGTQEV
jgi:hypothetical protein